MDSGHDLAEQDTDEMRQDIDTTRAAMADKLEALEDRVMGTVHSAQETVEDSLQRAKDTVATVKRNFDIKYQVEQHPWTMVGGCFLAGLALGVLCPRLRRRSRQATQWQAGNETPLAEGPRSFAEQRSNGSVHGAASPSRPQSMSTNRLASSTGSRKRSIRSKASPSVMPWDWRGIRSRMPCRSWHPRLMT
jgi:ElaB/YqjD/DUF883 family membrane-anchored ribosome-binding protein